MRGLAAFLVVAVAIAACVGDGSATIPDPTPDAGPATPLDSGGASETGTTTPPPQGDDDDEAQADSGQPDVVVPPIDSGTICGAGSQDCITTFTSAVTAKCKAAESLCESNCALGSEPAVCKQKCQTTFQLCQQTAEDTCTSCEASAHDCAPRADCHAHAVAP